MRSGNVAQNGFDLLAGKSHGQSLRLLCQDDFAEIANLPLENLFVQKKNGAQSLILRRRCDFFFHRQMRQELIDLQFSHLQRVAFVVKENEPPDPLDVSFLCAVAVVQGAYRGSDLIQ